METRTFGFNFVPKDNKNAVHVQITKEHEIAKLTIEGEGVGVEMDSNDLQIFGEMCIDLSKKMQLDHEARNACPECGGMLAHHDYCSMFVRKN